MIRLALCDDSKEYLIQMKSAIDQWANTSFNMSVDTFMDGDELLQAHFLNPYDILLLDMVMPLGNGIQIAREIRENDKNVKIIFLSSTTDYAFEAYSVKASNYLLKTYPMEQIIKSIEELVQQIHSSSSYVHIPSSGVMHRIQFSEIEVVEAQNKRVLFHLKDGRKLLSNEPLYVYEKILLSDKEFFKCHRSYIVNIFQIGSFTNKEIVLKSGNRLPISRNLLKEFEATYFSVLFHKAGDLS